MLQNSKTIAMRHRLAAWLLLAIATNATQAQDGLPAVATEQMVVAANPHATRAGIDVLRAGGSAVDAAIAVQLVLSLVEPQSSGIGGGAFLLHYMGPEQPGGRASIDAYSGRETAPADVEPDLFLNEDGQARAFPEVAWGGLSVGVPGVMRMLELAHRDHGRLPWSTLFDPAIRLAEEGFEISPRLYFLLDRFKDVASARVFRAHYYDADGEALATGHLLLNPEYAATLRSLAEHGADPMYEGALAREIVAAVRRNDVQAGKLDLDDLARFTPVKERPLCSPYREWTICGPQLPSSGGVTVQQILGIAQYFPISVEDRIGAIHVLAEASRLAFADRNHYLGDPNFVSVPVSGLLSPAYLRQRAQLIDPSQVMNDVLPGEPSPGLASMFATPAFKDVPSTSHFSIVDRWGHAVSMTTSVQSAFGSQLMVGGFLLNNQLTDFADEPEIDGRKVANRPEGGKRPLSSMAPTFVLDAEGRLRLIIGSPGGTRIIGYVAQTIVGVLDFGLDIQQAIADPHFIAQRQPIELEERTNLLDYADALAALGHETRARVLNSGLHGIVIDYSGEDRRLYGGADPRREGIALGD